MYFVLTVFTTVGFGDISAVTLGEILFVAFTMAVGAVVHSIIISEVIGVVTSNDATKVFVRQKCELMQAFCEHTELSPDTYCDLKSWIECSARHWVSQQFNREEMEHIITGKYMPRSLLGKLPEGLFDGKLIRNRIFTVCRNISSVPPRLPTLVALAVHRSSFDCEEIIYQINDYPFNLFLVIAGTFAYVARPTCRGGVPYLQPTETIRRQPRLSTIKASHSLRGNSKSSILSNGLNATMSTAASLSSASVWKHVQGTKAQSKETFDENLPSLFPFQLFPPGTYFGDVELLLGHPRAAAVRCESEGGEALTLH